VLVPSGSLPALFVCEELSFAFGAADGGELQRHGWLSLTGQHGENGTSADSSDSVDAETRSRSLT
jgi:hypothetical protein